MLIAAPLIKIRSDKMVRTFHISVLDWYDYMQSIKLHSSALFSEWYLLRILNIPRVTRSVMKRGIAERAV